MLPLVDLSDFYTFGNFSVSRWMLHLLLPFYVMWPHSPLQSKVGRTMPKGITKMPLVCGLYWFRTSGIRVVISVMCDWWKCCSILTSWVAGLRRECNVDFVEKFEMFKEIPVCFHLKSDLTVLCCVTALLWTLCMFALLWNQPEISIITETA